MEVFVQRSIGEAVKLMRKGKYRMNQDEFGSKSGFAQPDISDLERGEITADKLHTLGTDYNDPVFKILALGLEQYQALKKYQKLIS